MHSRHEIVKCSCGRVIAQCRCLMPDKPIRVVERACPVCAKQRFLRQEYV